MPCWSGEGLRHYLKVLGLAKAVRFYALLVGRGVATGRRFRGV